MSFKFWVLGFGFWVLGNPGVSVGSLCATEGTRYDGFPIESGMTKGEGAPVVPN